MKQRKNIIAETSESFLARTDRRISRAEDILSVIKEGIVRGYWKPEEKINDLELSEKLGVSRLTVREALSKLVERGLVEKRHWKGYTVRKLSWDEITSLIDVRLALEELALRAMIRRIGPGVLLELEEAIESSRRVVENENYDDFFRTDYVFHEILYRESGNPWISEILTDLHVLIGIVRFISQAEHIDRVAMASLAEHERILADLKAGRYENAVEHLRVHLNSHRERVRREYALFK